MEIKIEHLNKNYGKRSALKDISLHIPVGMYGLLGENGAGKTTLMRILATMLEASTGTVQINGVDIKNKKEIRKMIGYLPQEFSIYPNMTVYSALDYLGILSELPKHIRKQRINELLRQVNLEQERNKKFKNLSGGMKRRFGIAQALLNNPSILIIDEPTAGLDVDARNRLLDMLRDYLEKNPSSSILITSHISGDLEGLCDDIYMLHDGRIVLHEDTDVLLDKYAVIKVDEAAYEKIDKSYILKTKKERFGYSCFTNEKQFYIENYPGIIVENGGIDDLILMYSGGEK